MRARTRSLEAEARRRCCCNAAVGIGSLRDKTAGTDGARNSEGRRVEIHLDVQDVRRSLARSKGRSRASCSKSVRIDFELDDWKDEPSLLSQVTDGGRCTKIRSRDLGTWIGERLKEGERLRVTGGLGISDGWRKLEVS